MAAEIDDLNDRFNNVTRELNELLTSYSDLKKERDLLKCEKTKCVDGWKKFGCSCYFILTEWKTFEESRQECKKMGGDLVIVNNKGEQEFLISFKKQLWIGLTDTAEEGKWTWVDATPMTISFWYGGDQFKHQPDGGDGENCVRMEPGFDDPVNKWGDMRCSAAAHGICERAM